jgi:hypothetical protein
MRPFLRRSGVVCALALMLSIFISQSAISLNSHEGPTATGWWWKGQVSGSLPAAVPNPLVPSAGLFVSGDPSGPSGLSALRFTIFNGLAPGTLTLHVNQSQGTPVLRLCPITGDWDRANGGDYNSAPTYNCNQNATGAISTDGTIVTFQPAALQAGDLLDVAVVPAPAADGTNPSFAISFDAPGGDTLTLTTEPAPVETRAAPLPSTFTPIAPAVPLPQPTAFAAPFTPAPAGPVVQATPQLNPVVAAPAAVAASPVSRSALYAVLLLFALGVVYVRLERSALRAQLASMTGPAEGPVRGVSRFARPRAGEPPRI